MLSFTVLCLKVVHLRWSSPIIRVSLRWLSSFRSHRYPPVVPNTDRSSGQQVWRDVAIVQQHETRPALATLASANVIESDRTSLNCP